MASLSVSGLPALNAILNAASTILLVSGFAFIRRRKILAHKICMLSAVGCSALFLISYLTFHFKAGVVHFSGHGAIRRVYFAILTTHTILAATILPLVIITLTFALRARFARHKAIAHWTLPIWLYVSITGVFIYWLLFRLYPPATPSGMLAVPAIFGILRV